MLLDAASRGDDVHGWALAKATQRSGPTIYGVLDRLEDAGWVASRWEDQSEDSNRPRRRLYRLTPTGAAEARTLVTQRRPAGFSPLAWTDLPAGGPA
ncbi:PadR family transcriptional regulator [Paractinoplanes deccanensis]|nr:helix-turn-helix transcriptional regulator [Actinoplanes deccanensis]